MHKRVWGFWWFSDKGFRDLGIRDAGLMQGFRISVLISVFMLRT